MVDIKDNKELETENEEDFEYEYEYVEVPEGEEVPESEEGYEYEYEYVEVPEGEEVSDGEEGFDSADEELVIEDEPSTPAQAENLAFEPSAATGAEEDIFEEMDLDSFLKETGNEVEEVNLDDIIVEEVEPEKVEEINVDDLLSEDEDLQTIDFDVEKNGETEDDFAFEHTEGSGEKYKPKETKIETISLDDIEVEELSSSDFEEVILDDAQNDDPNMDAEEGVPEVSDLVIEELNEENLPVETQSEENVVDVVDVSDEGQNTEIDTDTDSDFKPFPFSEDVEPEEIVLEPEDVEEVSQVQPISTEEDHISDKESDELGTSALVSDHFAELLPVVPADEISSTVDTEEKIEIKTEEVTLSHLYFKTKSMTDEDYLESVDYARTVTKSDGISVFYSTRKQSALSIADVDMQEGELSQWNLVVLDRKMVSLNEQEKNLFPLFKNSVRLAKLIKNGQERVSFFNEEEYTSVPKTDSFGMVDGKFIIGAIEDDSGLLINDFINISLYEYYGKKLEFDEPISGMLVGPKGSILYFSNLKNLILPRAKMPTPATSVVETLISEVRESQAFFEISSQDEEKEFVGTEEKNTIQINVGITTYGWNVVFDNDVTMSVKDLMTYQSRNGKIPVDSGKIIYGRKVFKFEKMKAVVLYETPQYFSYGK